MVQVLDSVGLKNMKTEICNNNNSVYNTNSWFLDGVSKLICFVLVRVLQKNLLTLLSSIRSHTYSVVNRNSISLI